MKFIADNEPFILNPEQEFNLFVQDAVYGTKIHSEQLLHDFCENELGIAYCEENMDELIDYVIEHPYCLNVFCDTFYSDLF